MSSLSHVSAILPPRVDGEAFRSYYDRTELLNQPYAGAVSMRPHSSRWPKPDWCLPTGLGWFADTYGEVLGLPAATEWASRHTLAPYFQATLGTSRRERFIQRLVSVCQGPRRPLLALTATEWFQKVPVLCPECDEHSIASKGVSVVLRHWLLPFMTRCQLHDVALAEFPSWTPAERGRAVAIPTVVGKAHGGLEVTSLSTDVLLNNTEPLGELGGLLQSRGYTTRNGSLRRSRICALLARYACGRYEHPELSSLLSSESKVARCLGPLWNARGTLHPLVAQILVSALRDEPVVEQMPLWPFPAAAPAVDVEALKAAFLIAPSAVVAAKLAEVSVTTAVVYAQAAGIDIRRRPKVLKEDLRTAALLQLENGLDIADVAAGCGLSNVSVYRLLAANPGLRYRREALLRAKETEHRKSAWLRLAQTHPTLRLKQLRKLQPATYAYLYRWAREWLVENRPTVSPTATRKPSPSRSPDGTDFLLARRIMQAAQVEPMDMAGRKTATRLMADAGRRNGLTKSSLFAAAALRARAESLSAFVFRRLSAATAHLHNNQSPIAIWRVERRSRLRLEVIEKSGVRPAEVIAATKAAALRRM